MRLGREINWSRRMVLSKEVKKILKEIDEESNFFRVDWQFETVSFYSKKKGAYLFFSKFNAIDLATAKEMQRREN